MRNRWRIRNKFMVGIVLGVSILLVIQHLKTLSQLTIRSNDDDYDNKHIKISHDKIYNFQSNMQISKQQQNNNNNNVSSSKIISLQLLPPNETIAACLLVMDDTIKLTEWLAYHYTILPVQNLIVAIDPHSKNTDAIQLVLEKWESFINITIWTNDTWMEILPHEWWPQNNPNPIKGKRLKEHRRRQRTFAYSCMRKFKKQQHTWTLLTDTDEFLIYNYPHAKSENYSMYDTLGRGNWKKDIDQRRQNVHDIRYYQLPILSYKNNCTLVSFLNKYLSHVPCFHIPGLAFTSYEISTIINDNSNERIYQQVQYPNITNPNHLMTLRHVIHGPRIGTFSKAMVNLQYIKYSQISMQHVKSIHNPNTKLCGSNGKSGSGNDYIASIFRLNHYVGTKEAYLERGKDVRQTHINQSYLDAKNQQIILLGDGTAGSGDGEKKYYHNSVHYHHHLDANPEDDDDIRPWANEFVNKVGPEAAEKLLTEYLQKVYSL